MRACVCVWSWLLYTPATLGLPVKTLEICGTGAAASSLKGCVCVRTAAIFSSWQQSFPLSRPVKLKSKFARPEVGVLVFIQVKKTEMNGRPHLASEEPLGEQWNHLPRVPVFSGRRLGGGGRRVGDIWIQVDPLGIMAKSSFLYPKRRT